MRLFLRLEYEQKSCLKMRILLNPRSLLLRPRNKYGAGFEDKQNP
jgi:hypothetical protein